MAFYIRNVDDQTSTSEHQVDDRPHERVLRRSRRNRVISGVCGGLGAYLGLDPVLVRVGFIILGLASFGYGAIAYILLALAIPKERHGGEPVEAAASSGAFDSPTKLAGLALIAVGGLLLFNLLVPIGLAFKFIGPLLLVGVGVAVLLRYER